jgi:serine/threonine protein kinase
MIAKEHSKQREQPKSSTVLKKILTTVIPNKLRTKEKKSSITHKQATNVPPEVPRTLTSVDDDHQSLVVNSSDALRARSKSYSNLTPHKLEYNPYGIYNHHDIISLESAFGNGIKKSEPDLRLVNPLMNPNEYLPSEYKQEVTDLEDKYELLESDIGTGGSATIKKLVLKNDEEKIKIFALKKFSLFTGESQDKYYNRVAYEFIITKRLSQLHSMRCYDLMQLPITLQNAWGMTMDYYDYDLYKLIKDSNWKSVSFDEKMCIFKQICFGIKYLHENDVVHLDIKPDNILVSKNGLMKIADYGCAESGHQINGDFKSAISMKTKRIGTPPYQAPEVSKYHPINKDSREPFCPFRFDYWSLGILLFIIIIGKTPFTAAKDSDPAYKVYTLEYIRHLKKNPTFAQDLHIKIPTSSILIDIPSKDSNFVYLFWRLCDPNPKTRMTLPKLFKNEFFQKLRMCVDEKIYECNFCRHLASKDMKFKIPVDSTEEIVQQNEIKHSLWDDIPTTLNDSQKYNPLVSKNSNSNGHHIEQSPIRRRDSFLNHTSKLTPLKDVEFETESGYSKDENLSFTESDKEEGKALIFDNLRTNSYAHHYNSNNNFSHASVQSANYYLETYQFNEDDYSNLDAMYMIVNFKDILDACNYEVVSHSHNALYSYKKRPLSIKSRNNSFSVKQY